MAKKKVKEIKEAVGDGLGWVKIYRSFSRSESYFSEPFCRNMAWVDMLMLANKQPAVIRKRGVKVELKRGDIGMSYKELAERWGWSVGKVIRFLEELEIVTQIVTQKNNVTCCISIVNYEKYQGDGTAGSNASSNANGTQTVTEQEEIKNDKKEDGATLFSLPKTQLEIDYEGFNLWLKKYASQVLKMKEPITIEQFAGIQKDFCLDAATKELMKKKLMAMHNKPTLIKEYTSANLTLRNWMGYDKKETPVIAISKGGRTAREVADQKLLNEIHGFDTAKQG